MFRRILTSAAAGVLRAKVKETTGIVGLDVMPNAREVLISLYTKTLKEIQAVPEGEGYRKAVETFTKHRLQVCQEEEDWEMIEKRIGCGQVEELVEEAQDELKLIAKMIEWDPWGVPEDYECEVIEDDTPIPSHVPHHRLYLKSSTRRSRHLPPSHRQKTRHRPPNKQSNTMHGLIIPIYCCSLFLNTLKDVYHQAFKLSNFQSK